MYFGRDLYGCQSHIIVVSIKANAGLINFLLSKNVHVTIQRGAKPKCSDLWRRSFVENVSPKCLDHLGVITSGY
jgi:hypothetical protein